MKNKMIEMLNKSIKSKDYEIQFYTNYVILKKNGVKITKLPSLESSRCEICQAPKKFTTLCNFHLPFVRHGLPATPEKLFCLGYYKYNHKLSLADVFTQLILNMKHNNNYNHLIKLIGISLAYIISIHNFKFDFVTYVPSFKSKSLLNHELSKNIGKFLNVSVLDPKNWLIEKKIELGIIDIPLSERRNFVEKLFQKKSNNIFDKKNVLIIDDILISGESMGRVASIVRDLGAKKVFGAVLARSKLKNERINRISSWFNPKMK